MPAFLARENARGAPAAAIWLTSIAAQLFLFLTLTAESAFNFFVDLTSVTALIPYVFVGAFGLKLALRGSGYGGEPAARRRDMVQGAVATVATLGMLWAGGLKLLLLSTLLFLPGTWLFMRVRRERGLTAFTTPERLVALAILILAGIAAWGLWSGAITL